MNEANRMTIRMAGRNENLCSINEKKNHNYKKGNPMKNKFFKIGKMSGLFFILGLSLGSLINLYAQNEAMVDLDSTHQIIRGFGAANIILWRPDMTDYEIETAFGTDDGQLGFTILRLMIEPDKNRWGLNVATAKKAYDLGVTIMASPWYAPSEMVETANGVSRVRYDMYDEYAAHLDSFSTFMSSNGVPIYAVSIQNEPDYGDWTRWTSDEMLTFMKESASAIGTRVMAPESFQFRHSFSDPMLNDSAACANLDILGGHIYGAGIGAYPLAESKGKELWMTEHLSGENSTPDDWYWAFEVAKEINNVMDAGMSAYVWWYCVRYYGPISDGTYMRKSEVTKKGYIMSQFARFIRPGYYKLESTFFPQRNVYSTAYKDSATSKVVIVAINTASQAKDQTFVFQNGHIQMFTPYVTSDLKDCHQEADILVSNDNLNVTLDAESITTFVSSGEITSVPDNASSGPASFVLSQNYPNPFNPRTRINFTIPEKSFVSLKVYNTLGEEMDELAGKEYPAGEHSVTFDATYLADGVYFYTLETGDYINTRKMIVIK